MVANLIGQIDRESGLAHEIVVVTPDQQVAEEIKHRIAACGATIAGQPPRVQYIFSNLDDFLIEKRDSDVRNEDKFDYVEYNGGASKSTDAASQLSGLHKLLHNDGVIGLTYFARNHHVTKSRQLVDERDVNAMIPFSLDASRIVRTYLDRNKLGLFKMDEELIVHLGGQRRKRSSMMYQASELEPRADWYMFKASEISRLAELNGLTVASWAPIAYSHPFGEFYFSVDDCLCLHTY